MRRRAFIGLGIAAAAGLTIGVPLALSGGEPTSTGTLLRSRRPRPGVFQTSLQVPEVLAPSRVDAHTDYYDITQTRGLASILPDAQTEIWGYNGTFPGPTIVSRRGRVTAITHTNNLPVPTVVHLHGGRTPHDSDGYPLDFTYPADMGDMKMAMDTRGDTRTGQRTYTYPLDQRAATMWYHDHRMDFTGPGVWRGMAGFHLLRDDEEDALRLPSGARELPLMITDRSFDADGSLLYPSIDPTLLTTPGVTGKFGIGVLGDTMLVNGTPWPDADVDRAHYRLRLLNASNARRLDLRLDPLPEGGFIQIGTDGGLLAKPIHHNHLEIAPAQRFDVLVDFSSYAAGTEVTLFNDFGTGDMAQVMRFIVGDEVDTSFTVPDKLSTIEPLTPAHAKLTRTLGFRTGHIKGANGWLVNGLPFSPTAISAQPQLGTVEVWRLQADFHHPVHVHLSSFQILSRGAGGPGEYDAGWKDTIDLRPSEEAAIAIPFDGYPGKYVFHCHILEHEDMAMMANFETTRQFKYDVTPQLQSNPSRGTV